MEWLNSIILINYNHTGGHEYYNYYSKNYCDVIKDEEYPVEKLKAKLKELTSLFMF